MKPFQLFPLMGWVAAALAGPNPTVVSEENSIALSTVHNKNYICESWVNQDLGHDHKVQVKSLLECLGKIITPDKLQDLKKLWDKKSYVSMSELKVESIQVAIDMSLFSLTIVVPSEWQNPNELSVRESLSMHGEPRPSSIYSGFLNYAVNANISSLENDPVNSKDIQLNPVFSAHDFVFESYHSHNLLVGQTDRLDSFVTRDFEQERLRVRAGDNVSNTGSLFGASRFIGLKAGTEFSMSPGFVSHPLGDRDIYLDTPSRVEILVNGLVVKVLNLEAGRHHLRDIPTQQGLNEISLKITDAANQTRTIQFQMANEERLLKPGLQEYSLSAGKLTDHSSRELKYTEKNFAGFVYRRGLTTFLTGEISGAGTETSHVGAVSSLLAFPIGILRFDLGFSRAESLLGNASRGSYIWTDESTSKRFSVGAETFSPKFLANLYPSGFGDSLHRWSWFSNFSTSVTDRLSLQLSGSFVNTYEDEKETLNTAIQFNHRFGNQLIASLQYSESNTYGTHLIHEVTLNLSYQFDDRYMVLANQRRPSQGSQQTQVDLLYNNPSEVTNIQSSFSESGEGNSTSVGGSYGWQYADLSAGMSQVDDFRNSKVSRARFNPSGSIVFAGGKFGLGRKIRDSYAAIRNNRNEYLYLNGDESHHEISIPPGGLGVLTTTSAHQQRLLNFGRSTDDDIKSGEIFHRNIKIRPKLRSAALVVIEDEPYFAARGILRNAKGDIVSYASGRIKNLDTNIETKFFTDDSGYFYIEGLGPGSHEITLFNNPFEYLRVALNKHDSGPTEVGTIQLVPRVNN